jgi:ABC-type nitrate/sulfonate/bicarbonate transport system ATPase subunit
MKQAQAFINVSELIAWTVIAVGVSYLFDGTIKLVKRIHFKKKLHKANLNEIISINQSCERKEINVQNVFKRFNEISILNSFSAVFDNETVNCIKGPSGKGKTTLLKMLAEIDIPNSGEISYHNTYQKAFSFQDVRLLPWLTVSENIVYSVKSKHIRKQEIANLVAFLLGKMELADQGQKYPYELSGGQQQRVGLARALAERSDILMLDEPLTGLDNELKIRIIDFLSEWIGTYQPLVLWATHEDVKLKNLKIREVFLMV